MAALSSEASVIMPKPTGSLLKSGMLKCSAGSISLSAWVEVYSDGLLLYFDESRTSPKGSFQMVNGHTCKLEGELVCVVEAGPSIAGGEPGLRLQAPSAKEGIEWQSALTTALTSVTTVPAPPAAPIRKQSSLLDTLRFWRASEAEAPVAVGGVELGGEELTEEQRAAERMSHAAPPPVTVVEMFEIPVMRRMLSSVGDAVGATVGALTRLRSSVSSVGSAAVEATVGSLARRGSSAESISSAPDGTTGEGLASLSDEEEEEGELMERRTIRILETVDDDAPSKG